MTTPPLAEQARQSRIDKLITSRVMRALVAVRVTTEDKERMDRAAKLAGLATPEWVRKVLVKAAVRAILRRRGHVE